MIGALSTKSSNEFQFDNSGGLMQCALPEYPSNKSYYIWYKDSIPEDIDTSIISEEHELLYQSVKLNEYKSKLNMYVSVYTVCLTVVILMLLFSPFFPAAFASFGKDTSPVITGNGKNPELHSDGISGAGMNSETSESITWSSLGFTDIKNNVIYVILPNGKYSIQESSWNTKEKAEYRINKINLLDIAYSDGNKVKAEIRKVDLHAGGLWYRTMIGEFATIKEAIETAVEIRAMENL